MLSSSWCGCCVITSSAEAHSHYLVELQHAVPPPQGDALWCKKWQAKPEGGSLPTGALYPDGATMGGNDLVADVEPETQAPAAAGSGLDTRYPMKAFPEVWLLLQRDTWPFILDQYARLPAILSACCVFRLLAGLVGFPNFAGRDGLYP